MACDPGDLEQNIENLKKSVRKSFARVYTTLKARELKTLRQLDAIRKQCQDNKDLERNCVQNINICYNDESTLLDIISNYGVIDFGRLSFDNNTFLLEDYISPNDDHMYSYKTIEELNIKENVEELEAIEEAALKQITETKDCVCYVNIQTDKLSKKFRQSKDRINIDASKSNTECEIEKCKDIEVIENKFDDITDKKEPESLDAETKKINPTDDWLNSIKNHTETEPTQVSDVMEHSTITCS